MSTIAPWFPQRANVGTKAYGHTPNLMLLRHLGHGTGRSGRETSPIGGASVHVDEPTRPPSPEGGGRLRRPPEAAALRLRRPPKAASAEGGRRHWRLPSATAAAVSRPWAWHWPEL